MGDLQRKVKFQGLKIKHLFTKGVRVVSVSCKKGWFKVKHIRG